MTTRADTRFRTNDMVLATLLYMEGHDYDHELSVQVRADNSRHRSCTWVFDGHDEDVVGKFMSGKMRVEPREFARTWAEVRRHMFTFLNSDGRRRA